nr:hypothetical protein [uncultured bacterium]
MFFYGNSSAFRSLATHALAYAENLPERLIVATHATGTLRPYASDDLISSAVYRDIAMGLAIIA